jgi:hypothetical protein
VRVRLTCTNSAVIDWLTGAAESIAGPQSQPIRGQSNVETSVMLRLRGRILRIIPATSLRADFHLMSAVRRSAHVSVAALFGMALVALGMVLAPGPNMIYFRIYRWHDLCSGKHWYGIF